MCRSRHHVNCGLLLNCGLRVTPRIKTSVWFLCKQQGKTKNVISLCLFHPALWGLYLLGREGRHRSGPCWEWRDHCWGKNKDRYHSISSLFSSFLTSLSFITCLMSNCVICFNFSVIYFSLVHLYSRALSRCISTTYRLNTLSLMRGRICFL